MKKQHLGIGLMLTLLPTLCCAFTEEKQTDQKLTVTTDPTELTQQGIQAERFLIDDQKNDVILAANEIYHWIDENGVANFSERAPGDHVSDVNTLKLPEVGPEEAETDEDPFNVAEQAEKMKVLREEMADRRAAKRQRDQMVEQRTVIEYRDPEPAYPYGFGNRPNFPNRPPAKPEPPIEEKPNISTLKPLGRSSR